MKNWSVEIVRGPFAGVYRAGYFPRGFHYKRDAVKLLAEVGRNGGEARVVDLRPLGRRTK